MNQLNTMSGTGFDPASAQQMMFMPPSHVDEMEGNPYWDEHWGTSSVMLLDNPKLHEGYLTRYDIRRDEFEFNLNGQIKVAQGKVIKNVVWIDSVSQKPRFMVSARGYKLEGVPLLGFLEVLVEGEQQLIKRVELQVLKPNYNVALSTGSQNSRIVKKTVFYYSSNGELIAITSRKSLAPLFGEESDQMNAFIKKGKLRTNNEDDLRQIFTQLATLRPTGAR